MISNNNSIQSYLHCGLCLKELDTLKEPQSPKDYSRLEVGWTEAGFQVWCVRHNVNVIHVDFEGAVHPADTTRSKSK